MLNAAGLKTVISQEGFFRIGVQSRPICDLDIAKTLGGKAKSLIATYAAQEGADFARRGISIPILLEGLDGGTSPRTGNRAA